MELHRTSGLSVREFCERVGLSPPSFYAWRRKLREDETGAAEFVLATAIEALGC